MLLGKINLNINQPLVNIIIVTLNRYDFTEKCLASLLAGGYDSIKFFLVDNGSRADVYEYFFNRHQDNPKIEFTRSEKNLGFGAGCNLALGKIKEGYVVFLNNDTEVGKYWLQPIIDFMEKHPDVGACQPKIKDIMRKDYFEYAGAAGGFMDVYGYPFTRGRIFYTLEKDDGQYDNIIDLTWCSGTAMVTKKEALDKVGYFDEAFFMYSEEVDLCWRLKRAGYRLVSIPDSIVYHHGMGTMKMSQSYKKTFYLHRNGLIVIIKNYCIKDLIRYLPVRLLLDFVAFFYYLIQHPFNLNWLAVVRADASVLICLPAIYKKRQEINSRKIKDGGNSSYPSLYRRSIVFDYFILGKKKFSAISENCLFNDLNNVLNFKIRLLFVSRVFVFYFKNPSLLIWRFKKIYNDFLKNKKAIYQEKFYPGSSTRKSFFYHELPFDEGNQFRSCREGSKERLDLLLLNEDFRGKRILDLGCNVGFFSLNIALYAKEVVGIDHDQIAINKARELAKKYKIKNVDFICDKITPELLDRLGKFDVVLALAILPWINKDSSDALLIWQKIFENPAVYVELMSRGDGLAGLENVRNNKEVKLLLEKFSPIVHPIGQSQGWGNRTIWRCLKIFGDFKKINAGFQSRIEASDRFIKKSRGNIYGYDPQREFLALKKIEREGITPIPIELAKDYLIMTKLQGKPFDLFCSRQKYREEFKKILKSLQKNKIFHRDIRPDNLFIGADGHIYLLDFGWAVLDDNWYEAPKTLGGTYRVKNFSNKESLELIFSKLRD
jgi:GT2 family glycosyltransferase/SAM-dependent methyltransferase